MSSERATWVAAAVAVAALAAGATYGIEALGAEAKPKPAAQPKVTKPTLPAPKPVEAFTANLSVRDGSSYGAGMPVSIKFNQPVKDQQRVRESIKVTSDSGREIRGRWFSTQRLDFRPQTYWKAGERVTVKGATDEPVTFTVSRRQVSTVDVEAKTMTVERDGKVLKRVPISAGSDEHPTYNGAMVVSERLEETRMSGDSVGLVDEDGKPEYDIPDVPHAMRLTNSGTFIHGNYWANRQQYGKFNTTHGCIGMFDARERDQETHGKWFFENSMIGDVVEVKNSADETVKPDNGLNSWNSSWNEWMKQS
ncbi:Ig-like domain-containing protein [Streptomyces sp. NPDC004732]|uniref:L,D-transpeptidase n=1 Tax=Streptomyces sp. NPDC004732 TaxID=3154290 RepID=UPI0033BC4CCC